MPETASEHRVRAEALADEAHQLHQLLLDGELSGSERALVISHLHALATLGQLFLGLSQPPDAPST
ncbi:hypothetical protein [Streptodolium elevatio]